jgi:hypothetical protein
MPVPIQIGNLNQLPSLDKINYTRLDFDSIKEGVLNFIRTNYPDQQNDFFESNAGIMIIDILSYINDILAFRTDFLVNEAYLSTASTDKAILNLLNLINYSPSGKSSAIGTVQIKITDIDPALYIGGALGRDVIISVGSNPYKISISDNAGNPLAFELFKSSSDLTSAVIFPAGSVIGDTMNATIIEGNTVFNNLTLPSSVTQNFVITLPSTNIIQDSIEVKINGIIWRNTANFAYENGTTNSYEIRPTENSLLQLIFGDGIFGAIPPAGAIVEIKYRTGGGALGNINRGVMNVIQPINVDGGLPVTFQFTNITSTTGGKDPENLSFSKKIAPKNYAAQLRTVTGEDYTVYAIGYKDGTNGSISKALSIIRPYLAAYSRNNGPYNIDSTKNTIKIRIDDITRVISLDTGSNLTIEQIVDDFNSKAAGLFLDPLALDFQAFAYPTTNYKMLGTIAQPTAGIVTIDVNNNNLSFKYGVSLFNVVLPTGDRTYQQIIDDINTQINVGINTNLSKFRADIYNFGGEVFVQFVTVSVFNPAIDIFQIAPATNNAYVLLGFSTGQSSSEYPSFKFAIGLNYHNPHAALEVLNSGNNAYSVLGLDYSDVINGNGIGRALPMAANYVDIYVLANGENNSLVYASDSLKAALINFINRFKVLTDQITVWDGLLKNIGFNITLYVNKNFDANQVKSVALAFLNVYTNGTLNNFGDTMYLSKIYELLESINGVDHVTINDISENGVSQLTTGSKVLRDVPVRFNEVWVQDFITMSAVYNG